MVINLFWRKRKSLEEYKVNEVVQSLRKRKILIYKSPELMSDIIKMGKSSQVSQSLLLLKLQHLVKEKRCPLLGRVTATFLV